ncbi:MAG TPA: chemotaxis protein CheW [Gemmatimonadaceae bacterium]|nr:chemotaxis protein CheW [Gemmatimonadaceae bacterium]
MLLARAAGRWFGCPLHDVREVLPLGALARLPGAPPQVLGLLNVRGRLVTVLDLGRRLDPGADGAVSDGYVLIVAAGERQAGCRVDAVARAVPLATPQRPAALGNAAAGGIVMGIGEVDGEPVAVLDLPAFVRETLVDPGER